MSHALNRLRSEERDRLLGRLWRGVEADPRTVAAWLEGSGGRGDTDALSDLDLAVVVADSEVPAVAGGPGRPVGYGSVIRSARGRWVAGIAGEAALLLLEAPQNAPAGGAFLTSFFSGEYGPQQVDWLWLPQSTARRPPQSRVLFDRPNPPDNTAKEASPPDTAYERTEFEVAAHAAPWFWATLLWNAKHAARALPGDSQLPMLTHTIGAIHDLERFLELEASADPTIESTVDRLPVLGDLAARMERLMARAPELTADVPDAVPEQFRRYLDLVDKLKLEA